MNYKLLSMAKKIITVNPKFKDAIGVCPLFEIIEEAEKFSHENGDCGVFPVAIEEVDNRA